MILIPFLEATAEYQRLKAFRQGEITMISLEKSMAADMARFFRHQGNVLLEYLPEEFDADDFARAWDRTQLETYLEFRDLLLKHKRRAAYTCLRALENELSIPLEEAAKPRTIGNKISFDDFDEEAYRHIEQYAGARISQIDDSTKKDIREIIAKGFKGEVQPDGTTKYKTHQQIAKEIKDKFKDFGAPVKGPSHIRNRAHLVAVTELREAGETSKQLARDKMEAKGWQMLKRWMNMGDDRVSDGCIENGAASWIDSKEAFPSGHQFPPRFPGCRCGTGSRVGDRKERSGLPDDRWIVTRQGDRVIVKPNPKYKDGYDKPIVPVEKPVSVPFNAPNSLKNIESLQKEVAGIYYQKRDGYNALKKSYAELNDELDDVLNETLQLVRKADRIEDDIEYLKLKSVIDAKKLKQGELIDARNKVKSELDAFRETGRKEIYELLYHGEGGTISSNLSSSPSLVKSGNVKTGITFLEKIVSPEVQTKITPDFKAMNKKRADAAYWTSQIRISSASTPSTAIHEMGHLFESDPEIFRAVTDFYQRRTKGDSLTKLYKGTREYTKKDQFINPYAGKWYEWRNSWGTVSGVHINPDGQYLTEVVSMGAQHLYEIPGEFAAKDPEHFKLIMEIFRGMI